MVRAVHLSSTAERQLRKVPPQIQRKLLEWVGAVEAVGLDEVRKAPAFTMSRSREIVRGSARFA